MAWKNWIGRLLIVLFLSLAGAGYYLYQQWTDPEVVRAAVLRELEARFPGAAVQLDAAFLTLLRGVEVRGLSLCRRDESGGRPFASFSRLFISHDKKKLGEGKLAINRIRIVEPNLTLIRRTDGSNNLSGILPPDAPDAAIPPIEVENGTLTIIDETVPDSSFEIRDVQLTATPLKGPVLQLHGAGRNDLVGNIILDGTANRKTGELVLAATLPGMKIDAGLLTRLAAYAPELKEHGQRLEGKAAVRVDVAYHPESPAPWSYAIDAKLQKSKLTYPDLPFPIDDAEVHLQWNGGPVRLEHLRGRAEGAEVTASGTLESLSAKANFQVHIELKRLNVRAELYDKLPAELRKLCADLKPEGPVTLELDVQQTRGEKQVHYKAKVEGVSIEFRDFPYPVAGLKGTLTQDTDSEGKYPILRMNLSGYAGKQRVRIAGKLYGEGLKPGAKEKSGLELDITADNIAIDDQLRRATAIKAGRTLQVLEQLHPTGLLDIVAQIRRMPGNTTPQNRYVVRFHDATMRYDKFPYPLEGVEGEVEVRPDGSWRFYDARGRHKGGEFWGKGEGRALQATAEDSVPRVADPPETVLGAANPDGPATRAAPPEKDIKIVLGGTRVLLDAEMEKALPDPEMRHAWELFQPAGRVDFTATIRDDGREETKPVMDLELRARGCKLKPACFPYALSNVTGAFHYVDRKVHLKSFAGNHGKTRVSIAEGELELPGGGGFYTDLKGLRMHDLTVDKDFLDAVPDLVRNVFSTLRPSRPIQLVANLTLDSSKKAGPSAYAWNGHVVLTDTDVRCGLDLEKVTGIVTCRGLHDGESIQAEGALRLQKATLCRQPLENLQSVFLVSDDPRYLEKKLAEMPAAKQSAERLPKSVAGPGGESGTQILLPEFYARLHGGEVFGPMRFHMGKEVGYHVDIAATDIDLEQFRETLTRDRDGHLRGTATARLQLSGVGTGKLKGKGALDIPRGARLYDLPLIIDVLKFLSGRLPDGTAFSEAHARFDIEGQQVQVSQLELLGEAITLHGEGKLQTDGTNMDLEMYGMLPIWGRAMPLLPPVLNELTPVISKPLMRIRLEGGLGAVKIRTELLPLVTDPLKSLLRAGGWRGRRSM